MTDLEAWVEASCKASGVPFHITDPVLLSRVAVLLTAKEDADPKAGAATTETQSSKKGSGRGRL